MLQNANKLNIFAIPNISNIEFILLIYTWKLKKFIILHINRKPHGGGRNHEMLDFFVLSFRKTECKTLVSEIKSQIMQIS